MKTLVAVALFLSLTACAPHDQPTRRVCVQSHEENITVLMYMPDANGNITTFFVPQTVSVCDLYALQRCVKWKNDQVGTACEEYR